MKLRDLSELAGRNLREAVLRNTLTTMGIAVGVASLVAMLSLGVGLQELVGRRLERSGLFDSVLVRPRTGFGNQGQPRMLGSGGGPGPGGAPIAATPRPLDEDARVQLAHLPNVVEVYPEFRFTGDLRLGPGGHLAQIASLPPSSSGNDAFESMKGHFFSSPNAREIILQMDLAQELAALQQLQPADLLGKEVVVRYAGRQPLETGASDPAARDTAARDTAPRGAANARRADQELASPEDAALGFSIVSSQVPLQVVGIVDAEAVTSGGGGFGRAGAYVPVAVAQQLAVVQGNDMSEIVRDSTTGSRAEHYANLTVRVNHPSGIPALEVAVKDMGYTAFSLQDVTRSLTRVFAILDLLLGIFGSLALAVASLGIINTLVMAILERRREIGVLKALGASNGDIRQLFFTEAGVMGLAGGVAGVALGWGIGRVIQLVTTIYLRRQAIPAENIWSVPWWLVVGAIGFSVVVSLAAGMYPATRAAQLDPVEALRYE
jgi:putative ABC transport system permease protein